MIDQSITRRGRPCWYRNPGVGMNAINDAILIESGIYQLLRRHFKSKPYYMQCVELFHDVSTCLCLRSIEILFIYKG